MAAQKLNGERLETLHTCVGALDADLRVVVQRRGLVRSTNARLYVVTGGVVCTAG
jgi:hypothetical protein